MELIKFKLNEAIHSAYLYCETGNFEHLADIFRILFWNGKGEEVEEVEEKKSLHLQVIKNVVFLKDYDISRI